MGGDIDTLILRVTALEKGKDANKAALDLAQAELDTFYLMWAGAAASGDERACVRELILPPPQMRRRTHLPDAGGLCHPQCWQHPRQECQEHPSQKPA